MKVQLGGGRQSYEHPGYISIDVIPSDGVDIVYDLENGLPSKFLENSVDEFLAKHVLEHIRNLMPLMDDMWSVLKPDGVLHIMVPNGHHLRSAYSDPTHVRTFVPETFRYWTQESLNAYPYTNKAWRIHEGYPRVNGSEGDWWEIECVMSPVK